MKRATKPEEREIHLYVVRHQETYGNLLDIAQGQLPGRLTPRGHVESKKVAAFLKKHGPFDALYRSDQRRAIESSTPIIDGMYIPHVHSTTFLRERHYGTQQGKGVKEVLQGEEHPERLDGDEGIFKGTGAEHLSQLEHRASRLIDHIMHQPHNRVVLVGHQNMNTYIANHLLGQKAGHPHHKQEHNEVFHFTLDHLGRVKRWERLKAH